MNRTYELTLERYWLLKKMVENGCNDYREELEDYTQAKEFYEDACLASNLNPIFMIALSGLAEYEWKYKALLDELTGSMNIYDIHPEAWEALVDDPLDDHEEQNVKRFIRAELFELSYDDDMLIEETQKRNMHYMKNVDNYFSQAYKQWAEEVGDNPVSTATIDFGNYIKNEMKSGDFDLEQMFTFDRYPVTNYYIRNTYNRR